jgi:tetrapyrrole methylase family protein/MazG family protein
MDPEQVLRKANTRFETRFSKMIDVATSENKDWHSLTLEEKESFWLKAKKILKSVE